MGGLGLGMGSLLHAWPQVPPPQPQQPLLGLSWDVCPEAPPHQPPPRPPCTTLPRALSADHSELQGKARLRARDVVRVLICIESLCQRHM